MIKVCERKIMNTSSLSGGKPREIPGGVNNYLSTAKLFKTHIQLNNFKEHNKELSNLDT